MAEICACKHTPAKVTVSVQINKTEVTVLLDSGCGQTLVQENMARNPEAPRETIFLQCIHGDVTPSLSAQAQLTIGENTKSLLLWVALILAYPAVLV